jgi:CheY-like chemotaxis protein
MTSVLVVEDDKDLVYIYRMALGQAGYQVTMARSGREARQALDLEVPDLMFLDMNMPDESGLDVIRYVRADERFRNLRIVVITANPLWERQIAEEDIELFLVKPVAIADMVTLAKRLTSASTRS